MAWLTGNGRGRPSRTETAEQLAEKNRLFAAQIVREATGCRISQEETDEAYRTLSQCVNRVLSDCMDQMGQLAARLDPSSCGVITSEKFFSLADELFEADKGYDIRWERIVVLFAFTFVLSKQLEAQGHLQTQTEKLLASYLNDKISSWIQQRGGWNQICEEFSNSEVDDAKSVEGVNRWKSLLLLSGLGLGIGIAATFHKLSH